MAVTLLEQAHIVGKATIRIGSSVNQGYTKLGKEDKPSRGTPATQEPATHVSCFSALRINDEDASYADPKDEASPIDLPARSEEELRPSLLLVCTMLPEKITA